eukprot:5990-Heterococcus_DN1.PRE.1
MALHLNPNLHMYSELAMQASLSPQARLTCRRRQGKCAQSHVGFHCWSSAYTLLLRAGNNHRANNDRDQRPASASNAIVDRDDETNQRRMRCTRVWRISLQHPDFGGEFINEVNTALVTKFGMRKLRTSPYHPQTDGAVERSNAVVLEMLTQLAAVHKKDWHEHLLSVAFALRTSVDFDIGLTPFFLLYGRDARLPDSFVEPVQAIEASDAEGLNTDVYVEGLLWRMLMARSRVL